MPWTTLTQYQRAAAALDDPATTPEQQEELNFHMAEFARRYPDAVARFYNPDERVAPTVGPRGMQSSADVLESADIGAHARPKPAQPKGPAPSAPVTAGEYESPADEAARLGVEQGLDQFDKELPSASQLKSLYAPPEFVPVGQSFTETLTARYWPEPSLGMIKSAFEAKGKDVSGWTDDTPEVQRFRDAAWKAEYEQAERAAEQSGDHRPLIRTAYMNSEGWLPTVAQIAQGNFEAPAAAVLGAEKSFFAGIPSEAIGGILEKLTGDPTIRANTRGISERHPIAATAGAVAGALNPRSAVSRAFSGAQGILSRLGAGRLSSSLGAGAATGALASGADDVVQNAGEVAFADKPRLIPKADIPSHMGLGAAFGLGGAALGEGVAAGAGALVRRLRQGDLGPLLSRAEASGSVPQAGLRGVSKPEAYAEVEAEAARRGMHPDDVLAERLADPMQAHQLRRSLDLPKTQAAENAEIAPYLAIQKPPARNLLAALNSEIDKLSGAGVRTPLLRQLRAMREDVLNAQPPTGESGAAGPGGPSASTVARRAANTVRNEAPAVAAPEISPRLGDTRPQGLPPAQSGQTLEGPIGGFAPRSGATQRWDALERVRGDLIRPVEARRASIDELARTEPAQAAASSEGAGEAPVLVAPARQREAARRLSSGQLDTVIEMLTDLAKSDKAASPFKRLLAAAMKDRDAFYAPGRAMRKGDIPIEGRGAVAARHQAEQLALQNTNEAIGLPRKLKPAPEEATTFMPPRPALTSRQRTAQTQTIQGYRKGPGRREADTALARVADEMDAAVRNPEYRRDLELISSSDAWRQLTEKARLRTIVGMGGGVSGYTANAGQVAGLRLDPAARALSGRLPTAGDYLPLSPRLMALVRRLAGTKAPTPGPKLSTLEAVGRAPRLTSARQAGPAAAGGAAGPPRKSKLTPDELQVLQRLVELAAKEPGRAAAGGK